MDCEPKPGNACLTGLLSSVRAMRGKLLLRNLGMLYYERPANKNLQSLLYANLGGPA